MPRPEITLTTEPFDEMIEAVVLLSASGTIGYIASHSVRGSQ